MMEVVVTAGAIRHANHIITANIPSPNILQAGCHSCRPTNSVRALKGESITLHGLAPPQAHLGSSILVSDH